MRVPEAYKECTVSTGVSPSSGALPFFGDYLPPCQITTNLVSNLLNGQSRGLGLVSAKLLILFHPSQALFHGTPIAENRAKNITQVAHDA